MEKIISTSHINTYNLNEFELTEESKERMQQLQKLEEKIHQKLLKQKEQIYLMHSVNRRKLSSEEIRHKIKNIAITNTMRKTLKDITKDIKHAFGL